MPTQPILHACPPPPQVVRKDNFVVQFDALERPPGLAARAQAAQPGALPPAGVPPTQPLSPTK